MWERLKLWLGIRFLEQWAGRLMGEGWHQKIASAGLLLGGAASMASGLSCLLSHFGDGSLLAQCPDGEACLRSCLAQIIAGAAIFSPGLNALKVGAFSRPNPNG